MTMLREGWKTSVGETGVSIVMGSGTGYPASPRCSVNGFTYEPAVRVASRDSLDVEAGCLFLFPGGSVL
jgi:hypothetical protein